MANQLYGRPPWLLLAAAAVLLLASSAASGLTTGYYRKSCPRAEQIVAEVVMNKQITSPTTAAGALRLFFHDCFVGGCDASVLVSTNAFNRAEREADINLSLPGDAFDAVVRAKTALELACPGAVSCADILALAARDLVTMLGGPFFAVPLGRKDGLASRASAVEGNLPRPNMTAGAMVALFAAKGFSVREMVALAGAHTVGFSHCKEFAARIFQGGGAFDSAMEPRFARALKRACANYLNDGTISTFNDVMTPGKFDNMYYLNLKRGLGLLASDQALAADARTRPFVDLYASNQSAFFGDFSRAMVKLSLVGVKTESNGEVRRRCDQFNNLAT
ncbi:peroxidase 65-like [Zingiber officinale]|uniref:peroxidase n=1 Tax=Zingiber officinale TaxID=94328 RepID=A0A8J5G9G2_ZINOF|nr:peroxidase 65-like [Zingiber officinale]KAG6502051.1 hypothetical protein ZIOFF_041938 [Zingiber officinale]